MGSRRLEQWTCRAEPARRTAHVQGVKAFIQGDPSVKLETYKANAPFQVDAATVRSDTSPSFALPRALRSCATQVHPV